MRKSRLARLLFVLGLGGALIGCATPATPQAASPLPGPTSIVDLPQFDSDTLPVIQIVSPADGFQSRTPIVTFEWDWDVLPDGQQFAVLLWREGNAPVVVQLTTDRFFYAGEWIQLHGEGPGVFFWQVIVVQIRPLQPPLALTNNMTPRRFEVASLAIPTPIMTPVNLVASPPPPVVDNVPFVSKRVINNVKEVTAIAFAPDGRMFFNQKEGLVRVFADGKLQPDPVISFPVDTKSERGLISIAIDPDFATNHYIWVSLTRAAPSGQAHDENQVVRFVEKDGHGADPQVALSVTLVTDSLAHMIGNLHFGPDGMLYMEMGENGDRANAQNPATIPGKIHRFLPTVPLSVPKDSFLPGNSMVAMGFRNSWGFSIDPVSRVIFAGDNGAHCDDEVNRVVPGGNYGWHPSYLCDDDVIMDASYPYNPPLIYFTPPIAPSGMAFYTGDQLPVWHNDLFFCSLILGRLLRVQLNAARTNFTHLTQLDLGQKSCWAAVDDGPDGTLYYSSANAIFHIVAP